MDEVQEFCKCLGDIVAAVHKVENLISFKGKSSLNTNACINNHLGTMNSLEGVINKTTDEMMASQNLHKELKKGMGDIKKVIDSCIATKNYQ